jgi:glycyl-tRNA synthetase (class II)
MKEDKNKTVVDQFLDEVCEIWERRKIYNVDDLYEKAVKVIESCEKVQEQAELLKEWVECVRKNLARQINPKNPQK